MDYLPIHGKLAHLPDGFILSRVSHEAYAVESPPADELNRFSLLHKLRDCLVYHIDFRGTVLWNPEYNAEDLPCDDDPEVPENWNDPHTFYTPLTPEEAVVVFMLAEHATNQLLWHDLCATFVKSLTHEET
jgi:hypothetical protein